MKLRTGLLVVVCFAMVAAPCRAEDAWKTKLDEQLPLLGHRNWIVIADAAYPWHTSPGIATISTGARQEEVVQAVLDAIAKTKHLRPVVYTDLELDYVHDAESPGADAYRQDLLKMLGPHPAQPMPHAEIMAALNDASKTYRVLLLKTTMTIPYSSVFLQLDCGYWSADSERRMREAMKTGR